MNINTKFQYYIQDDMASQNPAHIIKIDRRLKNNERRDRGFFSFNYNGPARRLTIDRRLVP